MKAGSVIAYLRGEFNLLSHLISHYVHILHYIFEAMPVTFANALTPKENEMTNLSAGYPLAEFLNCFIMRNSSVMMGKK